MKSTQRFSVLIWTDKRKTDSQGNVPLYARITYLGKRAEISINAIADYNFKVTRLAEVRDTFLFCCYTGYAFIDVEKLTPEHIAIGLDRVSWIRTTRTKSDIAANVPLIPRAMEIVERYKDHPSRIVENRLLPVKSNQKMNAYLKEIGDLAGVNKILTTHIARHTFATTVTLENDVPLETVSKMLGHTKLSTTQIYAKMKDRKVNRDMHALKARISDIDEKQN
jgi:integrase